MKYKITLTGFGCDSRVFKITDEQYTYLKESGVEDDELSLGEIEDYLQKELFLDDFDDSIVGPYLDETFITVEDESGNEVYDGRPSTEKDDDNEWVYIDFEGKENYFVLEDYSKGTFFVFEVESETFDVDKLSFLVKDIADSREIIIDAKYNGINVTKSDEYIDYWSKGIYYLLSKKQDDNE
jgi:hypothetical protein